MTAPVRISKSFSSAQWIVPVLILLLAFALRFYHLGDKGLWGDEIAQARWALFPLAKMWERFRDPPDFILHFLFGQFALQFGASAFWARLPSAFTSMLVVPATYVLARRLASQNVAWLAMLLVALSPFQIWYAQDARMYAALAGYATLSFYFFARLWDAAQWRSVIGLTAANALALYTHLFGALPLGIEGVAWGTLTLGALARGRGTTPRGWFSRAPVLMLASFGLTALLALPLAPGTLPYLAHPTLKGIEAAFGEKPFQITLPFMQLLLSDLGLAPDMGWRMYVSLACALIGVGAWARAAARRAFLVALWLALPLLLLQLARPGHTVANRYLIFLQPVYLVAVAYGMLGLLRGAQVVLARAAVWRAWDARARWLAGAGLVCVLLALQSVAPLRALYARAKLNDWQTLARFFETHATPGDVLMVEPDFWGMKTLAYYVNVNRFSSPPATVAELDKAYAEKRNVWYMSFGGYLNPLQEEWVKTHLTRVAGAAWMRPALVYEPRDEFHFTQSEPLVVLYTRAGKIPSAIVYANELGDRPRATPYLPLKPGETLEAQLQADEPEARVLSVEYASQEPAQFEVYVEDVLLAVVRAERAKREPTRARWTVTRAGIGVRVKNVSERGTLLIRALRLTAN